MLCTRAGGRVEKNIFPTIELALARKQNNMLNHVQLEGAGYAKSADPCQYVARSILRTVCWHGMVWGGKQELQVPTPGLWFGERFPEATQ